jgi:hypothetical protein
MSAIVVEVSGFSLNGVSSIGGCFHMTSLGAKI